MSVLLIDVSHGAMLPSQLPMKSSRPRASPMPMTTAGWSPKDGSIGAGRIGTAAFTELLAHPATAGIPVIVETPSGKEHEGHAADIALLKSLRPQR